MGSVHLAGRFEGLILLSLVSLVSGKNILGRNVTNRLLPVATQLTRGLGLVGHVTETFHHRCFFFFLVLNMLKTSEKFPKYTDRESVLSLFLWEKSLFILIIWFREYLNCHDT